MDARMNEEDNLEASKGTQQMFECEFAQNVGIYDQRSTRGREFRTCCFTCKRRIVIIRILIWNMNNTWLGFEKFHSYYRSCSAMTTLDVLPALHSCTCGDYVGYFCWKQYLGPLSGWIGARKVVHSINGVATGLVTGNTWPCRGSSILCFDAVLKRLHITVKKQIVYGKNSDREQNDQCSSML